MRAYVLLRANERPAESLDLPCPASRVTVSSERWSTARAEALQHAIDTGEDTAVIMLGSVQLYHKPHWTGRGQEPPRRPATDHIQAGLWQYTARLARRYAHVYVPPVTWVHAGYINTPVIPSVAAYSVRALQSLDKLDGPVGFWLVQQGYDSFTVSDYTFHNLGDNTLHERGDATTWSQAHGRAIDRHL